MNEIERSIHSLHSMEIPVWAQTGATVIKKFSSSQSSGLNEHQVEAVAKSFGRNTWDIEKETGKFKILLQQIKSPMVYTLLGAALLAWGLGEVLDAAAILFIVLLNVAIGYFQEAKAASGIEALKKLNAPKARVLRNGSIGIVNSADILPGDILVLEAGDFVVADARVLEAYQLSVNEAILTGESFPVEKHHEPIRPVAELADRLNMLFAGTTINMGSGRAIVVATGLNTEIGHIANLLKTSRIISTPLQQRLEKVSYKLLFVGGGVIVLVTILGLLKNENMFDIFMTAISLAIAAIPEGLPTIVTLALTLAVRRMTSRQVLVRNMTAIETLGTTDIICTDKTGTLTTGKMKVREVYDSGLKELGDNHLPDALLAKAMVLCNNASLEHEGSGDTTELALLMDAEARGIDISELRQHNLRKHEWSFESERKRMSVAIEDENGVVIFCKGAPEALLPLCKLPPTNTLKIERVIAQLSDNGRRVLAFAWKRDTNQEIATKVHFEVEKDFQFLGLVSISDPPREDTISSIEYCKKAGVKVAMITGDHPNTARAIARELGIPDEGSFDKVMTGQDLSKLTFESLCEKVESTAVYARVNPDHKLRIIEALQHNGHIVAMTGDGVNDAPALKRADIGVAMGKGGTEVARQASSMILTDDNFSSIKAAIEEGRAVYGNIKRTIQYLLSTNLSEILIVLGASILGLPMPLNPLAILWINLVTDGFPSLALAAEPVEKDILKFSDKPSPGSFFDSSFVREMVYVALLMTILELVVYSYALTIMDVTSARSFAFTLLIYLSLFRSFSCRSDRKTFFQLPFNYWHLSSVIVPVLLQLVLQHTELYHKLFNVRGLSLIENGVLFLLSLIPVTIVELSKFWRR